MFIVRNVRKYVKRVPLNFLGANSANSGVCRDRFILYFIYYPTIFDDKHYRFLDI